MDDFKSVIWSRLSDADVKAFFSPAVPAEILRSGALTARAKATKPFLDEMGPPVKSGE